MRKLIYYVAVTVDGYIARRDGSFDGFPWDDEFGAALLGAFPETFPAHLREGELTREGNRRFDAVLMGRKTYEVALAEGITNPYPTLDQYLVSRSLESSPDPAVELISADAVGRVAALKEKSGRAIWLCGGSELATTLLAAGLIDELVLKLNPVLFGDGIPLFARSVETAALKLIDSTVFTSGHALLHYRLG